MECTTTNSWRRKRRDRYRPRLHIWDFWRLVDEAKGKATCIELNYSPHFEGGYPLIRFEGKQVKAHKLILTRKLGRPLNPGYETCHSCDNPKCINENHIYEGTHQRNMLDRERNRRRR